MPMDLPEKEKSVEGKTPGLITQPSGADSLPCESVFV